MFDYAEKNAAHFSAFVTPTVFWLAGFAALPSVD